MAEDEQPTDEQLKAAGFDLADDLDRPDRHCDCPKCKAFYAALDGVAGAHGETFPHQTPMEDTSSGKTVGEDR